MFIKLSEWIIADLQRSGLSDDTIEEMRIEEVKGPKGMERLNQVLGFSHIDKQGILLLTPCYLIPYPCPDFTRVKLRHAIEGAKYLSPKKSHTDTAFHLYFLPKDHDKIKKQKYALIVTEGEKKTAKLTQELRKLDNKFKAVAVGIPGVTMWNGCPEWKEIRLTGREVYEIFDSDFHENPDVQHQMLTLFLSLRKQKANVKVIVFDQGKGIDDYLVIKEKEGCDSKQVLTSLMENAEPNIFNFLSHINTYKLVDAVVSAFYSVEEDCASLWEEFKLAKKYGITFATFKKMVLKAHKQKNQKTKSQQTENQASKALEKVFPIDELAPLQSAWNVPSDWQVDEKGIQRIIVAKNGYESIIKVAHAPFIISGRSVNVDTGNEQLQVSFPRDKQLRKIVRSL